VSNHIHLGQNDYAYSDRSVVCMQDGAGYQATLVSQAIASNKAMLIDSTDSSKVGFRLQKAGTAHDP
jgi:hypothetical protein